MKRAKRRRNPPPRRGALIEVERREAGYFYRHPLGHLAGPYGTATKARAEGALALAAALHPQAPRAELYALAEALLTEDPARPYARQFSDGWRVWDPERRIFVGAAPGVAFASRGAAEAKRRALAGEAEDDGPMFRRPAPTQPATRAGEQLGLFGTRPNPSLASGRFNFSATYDRGTFRDGAQERTGDPWIYVEVVDPRGEAIAQGVAITDLRSVGASGVQRGVAWVADVDGDALDDGRWHEARGRIFRNARWEDDDPQSGRLVVATCAPRRRPAARANPARPKRVSRSRRHRSRSR